MDKEKLNKAADRYLDYLSELGKYPTISNTRKAFIEGAKHLLYQPLSEKMTEEEKAKINALYEEIYGEIMCAHDDDDWQGVAHYILDVMPRTFRDIFGSDIFNQE